MRTWATSALFVLVSSCGSVAAQAQATGTPFYQAIRNNDLAAVRALLRKSDVNTRDPRGATPLMYAAAVGSLEAMKLLAEAGADINARNAFDATALMWCAGDLAKVRFLLSKGADVTAHSKLGRTPLVIAAMYDGASEIIRLLMEKGADVSARDKEGVTALESAATVNDVESARLLLAKGADPNTKDSAGFTPLLAAASNGDRSTEMVKLLLQHGAAVNVACAESLELVKNGPLRLGSLTPLMVAVPHGNYATVELLVNAGADINAKDARGMTALTFAVSSDHPDPRIVRLLLAKGADPSLKSKDGETALDWAMKYQNPEILAALGSSRPKPAAIRDPNLPGKDSGRNIQAAVAKSVALMQRTSAGFQDSGGCLSCHAQHFTGLAVQAARANGVKTDATLEAGQARATSALRGALEQTLFQVVDPTAGVDALQFSLMQMSASAIPPSTAVDSLVFHIAAMQRKEGDWPNYGVARPPIEDGGFSHTTKGIRVLQLYSMPGRKAEFDARIVRAAGWLQNANPRTTEDRTMQILGIRWANRKPPEQRLKELIALQRPDGGWGQTADLPSDAYATGEVLYTLHEAGIPANDVVYQRGVEFLLRTQLDDGSWHVKTRAAGFQPYFESGFPHGHDQWISQAGTAWAVMALAYAIPTGTTTASVR